MGMDGKTGAADQAGTQMQHGRMTLPWAGIIASSRGRVIQQAPEQTGQAGHGCLKCLKNLKNLRVQLNPMGLGLGLDLGLKDL